MDLHGECGDHLGRICIGGRSERRPYEDQGNGKGNDADDFKIEISD